MAVWSQGNPFTEERLAEISAAAREDERRQAQQQALKNQALYRETERRRLTRDRTMGELAGDTGLALLQGAVDLGSAAYGVGNILTGGGLESVTGMADNFEQTDAFLEDAKSDQLSYQKMMAGRAFDEGGLLEGAAAYLSNPGLMADMLVRSAPSILPGAAAGGAAARAAYSATNSVKAASTAAARGATAGTSAQTGGMAYTDAYNQAIEEGLTPEEANARAYGAAAIVAPATAASMAIPGLGPAAIEGQVLGRMATRGATSKAGGLGLGLGRTTARVGEATAKEAGQELIQGSSEQIAQNAMSTEKKITDNLGQAAVLSTIAGGAMGLGVGAMRAPSDLRKSIDQLRTDTAEESGDASLGLSEIEKTDARNQGTEIPDYLYNQTAAQRAETRGQPLRGRDLLGGELRSPEATSQDETVDLEAVPTDFAAEASETGQGVLFDEADARPPEPEVGEAQPSDITSADLELYMDTIARWDQEGNRIPLPTVEETTPEVREIETNTDNELEEAIQISELFQPRIRDALQAGITTESEIIRGVAAMRESGLLPPRVESENTQRVFDSVTTPSTGITEADLYSPPTESPEGKAFKAYQRRVAQRGKPTPPTIPEGRDLLGSNENVAYMAEWRRRAAEERASRENQPAQDTATGDLFQTTPNAIRPQVESTADTIERTAGVTLSSGMSQADFQTAEDAYINEQFRDTGRVDSDGYPIYEQYDRNIQTFVEVSAAQARAEASEFIRQKTAKPSDLFREVMAKEFDLSPKVLRGRSWNRFAEEVDKAGVRPLDENVAGELSAIAAKLGNEKIPNSKFFSAFMNKYGPGTDISETAAEPTQVEVDQDQSFTGRDWKQALSKKLGLKPSQMRGKAWNTFDQMVRDRNVGPADENADAFLAEVSAAIEAPPESAPAFAATLRSAYPVAEPEPIVVPDTNPEPSQTSEVVEDIQGFRRREGVAEADVASRRNVELRTEFFKQRFDAEADAERNQYNNQNKAKPAIASLLKKMTAEISYAEDVPVVANAMVSKLAAREFTPKQRLDAFYRPLANRAQEMMAEAETTQDLDRVMKSVDQVFGQNSGFVDRTDPEIESTMAEIEAELAGYKGDRLDMLLDDPANANNNSKFSRTGEGVVAGEQISAERFRKVVDRANRNAERGEKQIRTFDTVAEAEQALGISMPADTNGVYYNGEAAVIRQNIRSEKDLADAIFHERAHGGLEGLLGRERLRAVQNRLWANNTLRKRIRAKMESHNLSRQDAAEEVLVDMLVAGEEFNKSIFSKLRAAIQRVADTLLGVGKLTLGDGDVRAILQDTASYMKGGKAYAEGPTGRYKNKLSQLEAAVEGEVFPTTPKFSQAGIDLEAASRTGEASLNGMRKASATLGEAVREAVSNGSFKPLSELTPPSAKRFPSTVLNFMPLRAIARHYQGLLNTVKLKADGTEETVDTLHRHAELVRGRDNDFNKTLNEDREYTYYGPDGSKQVQKTSPKTVSDAWTKFRKNHEKKARAFDKLNNRATTYKLHPDRSWDQQTKLDYTNLPYTEAERKQQFDALQKEWQQIGKDGQSIYRQSQAIYNQFWTDRFNEVSETIRRESGLDRVHVDPETGKATTNQEWVAKWRSIVDTAMSKLKEGPYSPLQRHGDFFVTVRDGQGNVLSFMAFDTEQDAMVAKRQLEDSQTDPDIKVQYTVRREFDKAMDGMNRKVYANLESAMEATFSDDSDAEHSAKDALKSVYLASLGDSHILKHGMKRKLVEGASMDTLRSFTSYAMKSARSLSSMRYDYQIEDNLRDMEKAIDPNGSPQLNTTQTRVYEAVRRQHKAAVEYKQNRLSDAISQFGFIYWMTSPAQMALNASQTALVTVPRLAAKYNVAGAGRAVRQATAKFAGTKFKGMHDPDATTLDKNSPHYRVMRELYSRGVLDFTLSHDMSGLSRGDSFGMNEHKRTALRWMSSFMHGSEVANREIAAYASVELELENNPDLAGRLRSDNPEVQQQALAELTDAAESMVDTTQFDYSQSNKPASMQGPVARVVFQFQQFRINMLAMMASDIKQAFSGDKSPEGLKAKREARRALAYMTGVQLMATGAAGSVLAPVAFMIMDLFRDDDELLNSREEFIQSVPQWMSQGLLSFGLDTSRFAWDSLLPFSGANRWMPVENNTEDQFHWLLTNSLGAWVGLADNMVRGVDSLKDGDYVDAIDKLAPNLFGDPAVQILTFNEPTKTRDDISYYSPSGYERLLNAIGLKSGSQAEAGHDRTAVYNGLQRARDRKQSLMGQYHLATTPAEQQDAWDEIVGWNRTNPELAITSKAIKASRKSRQQKQQNADALGVPLGSNAETARRLIGDQ